MTQAAGNHKNRAERPKQDAPLEIRADTAGYFSWLRLRVKLVFLTAFLIPLIALSAYFYIQFNATLKESGKLHLVSLGHPARRWFRSRYR